MRALGILGSWLVFLSMTSAAFAVPYTHFARGLGTGLVASPPADCRDGDPFIAGDTVSSSGSIGCSFPNADGTAAASADLATGTLKAEASLTVSPGFVGGRAEMRGLASIADSFRTFSPDGSPFDWSGMDATFTFDLDGSFSGIAGSNRSSSTLSLWLLKPGGVDAYITDINSPGLGSDEVTPYIIDQIYWQLNTSTTILGFDLQGNLTSFPTTVSFTFAPGGDFDWVLSLNARVVGQTAGTLTADFFDTLTTSYAGPDGSVTRSASGVFPGTLPLNVPEPGTLSLLGAGLLGLLGFHLSRRRAPFK